MIHGTKTGPTVLVAGGAGFIGSHLCDRLLQEGNRVICLDNYQTGSPKNIQPLYNHPGFSAIEADICALPQIEPVDRIYNLACAASPPLYQADPVHTMMTCVVGTRNLLKKAELDTAVFLQASTSEVYGDPAEHPQREDYRGSVNCTGPRACYDEGKRAAEALCFDLLRAGKVDVRVARIFNTYGPRMQPHDGRIVSNIIVQALCGESLTIYGTGLQTRSFCFVDDLVTGLTGLMDLDPNPKVPVNLGNPEEFSIVKLAELVTTIIHGQSSLRFEKLPADDPVRRRPDISRARELLGWAPKVRLAEGLARTIAWFESELGGASQPRDGLERPRLETEVRA